ncbi:MAG: JDVT-CTERM system glutamic-type intramembrane protease [Granulosicoccus sp.]
MYALGVPLRQQPLTIGVVLLSAFAYPILEELVFRGAVQSALLSRGQLYRSFAGVTVACLITSLLFAAAHLVRHPPLWAALIFVPSLVFGWARDRHQSLYSPIALHITYNAGFIALFYSSQ